MSERILPGISRVGGRACKSVWYEDLPVISSPKDANVYLLQLDGANVLVDAGSAEGMPMIEENIRKAGIEPGDLTDLIMSHSHYDHSHGVPGWQKKYGLKIHLNAVAARFLQDQDYRLYGHLHKDPGWEPDPFDVTHAVADEESFAIGQTEFKAYTLPGHTPDSTVYLFEKDGRSVAICGDITFALNAKGNGGLGALARYWQSNCVHYEKSLEKMLSLRIDVLLSGHYHAVVGADKVRTSISASLTRMQKLLATPEVRHFGCGTGSLD